MLGKDGAIIQLIFNEWGTDSTRWQRLAEKEIWLCIVNPWSFERIEISI
jgi:hypothetical protein